MFLTGEFNSTSHLYRSADAPAGDVTRLLAEAGLRDSYREAHADPAQRPGYTFTPGAPHAAGRPERTRIRIDYACTGRAGRAPAGARA